MNTCIFSGNVGKDAEIKTYGELNVAETTLAVKRRRKDSKTGEYPTDWLFLRVVGQKAKQFAQSVKKGDKLTVSGELETFRKKDGSTGFNIFVEKFDFPDRGNREKPKEQPASSNGWRQQQRETSNDDPFSNGQFSVNEDDLPF